MHLGVALEGTGWHPASWRAADARPADLLTAGYWTDVVREAERGLLDFVTIEDGLTLQSDHPFRPDRRTDRVRGRVDAGQIAARVAPRTRHIGLIPTAITTHTEPFHLSKAIATLDFVSNGRAGVRVQVSSNPESTGHFGRPGAADPLAEAADHIAALRRSWPSPPPVAALGHGEPAYRLIASSADIGFLTPADDAQTATLVRRFDGVLLFADLVVFLGDSATAAAEHREFLDVRLGRGYISDAEVFVGTAGRLADLMIERCAAGLAGFRLRPAVIPHDLAQITGVLVPELQRRGVFRDRYRESTLRARLGLDVS